LLYDAERKSSLEVLNSSQFLSSLSDWALLLVDEESFFVLSKEEQNHIADYLKTKDILLLLC
jgi:hypothetical protein